MAKKKKNSRSDRTQVPLPGAKPKDKKEESPPHVGHNALRETLESLAIAFMLAFFIRTFVVEAFVIPTGSMSPALQGVHKDLLCPECGERFRVNASEQGQTAADRKPQECLGGMCPMCRHTVSFSKQASRTYPAAPREALNVPSYNGDRIIVNKFLYSFAEPERWDVVVFKYPGEATQNYIKRLVGLPNETLQIFGGDLYTRPNDADADDEFAIERKPPRTVHAMRQAVHDTDRDTSRLYNEDWPLRWVKDEGKTAWDIEVDATDRNVRQRFISTADSADKVSWLRYVHTVPSTFVWPAIENGATLPEPRRKLIGDFNPYNTRITRESISRSRALGGIYRTDPFVVPEIWQGIHWVGDLLVEADVDFKEASGELILELVEAGHRFRCRLDLAAGTATLEIVPYGEESPTSEFTATARSPLIGHGKHRLLFANVDDALYLWIDDRLVEFDQETTYDWEAMFGNRRDAVPRTSDSDPGDLAPVGIGVQGTSLAIDRLRVWRDIYYLAAEPLSRFEGIVTDYASPPPGDILYDRDQWHFIAERKRVNFPLEDDQFFVMGDNSPQSQDARLWHSQLAKEKGAMSMPGGSYLERRLLIGRAISVVWPHTWNWVIPGFTDMRRIE